MFAVQAVGGCVFYLLLASLSDLVLRRTGRAREVDRALRRKELLWSTIGIVGTAVLSTPLQYLVAHGRSKVYVDVGAHGYGWLAASALLYLFVTETMIYWIHRFLHAPLLYRHVHRFHHAFRAPTPWTSFAFHPLDSFAQALPHYLCAFLFPVHLSIYLGMLVFVSVWTVLIHDGVSLVRHPAINYTGHHTAHHRYNKDNYGQFFTLWDRIGGTYRAPDDA